MTKKQLKNQEQPANTMNFPGNRVVELKAYAFEIIRQRELLNRELDAVMIEIAKIEKDANNTGENKPSPSPVPTP